jgi:hypothetical protein
MAKHGCLESVGEVNGVHPELRQTDTLFEGA